ncbi:hypothetical protein [Enterobacter genomosp. S]|uniref:hypothetical protein n=1 Tax=Enterobacter genomosp. S TaxID=2364151 RepID=UPI000AAF43A9|nr:hypothetical protein [Enterobacter genomosp. S]
MRMKLCVLVSAILLAACNDTSTDPHSIVIKGAVAQEDCGLCNSDKIHRLIMRNFIENTFRNLAQRPLELSRLNGNASTAPVYYFANDFREDIFIPGALEITSLSSIPSAYQHCTCSAKIQFSSDAFAESVGTVNYRYCVTEKTESEVYKLPSVSLYDMYINDIPLVRMAVNGQS